MSSLYDFKGPGKNTARGHRERVSVRNGRSEQVLLDEQHNEPTRGFITDVPMAVVGSSVTVGMSTEYAREKIEVSVWESRPVFDNPADRQRVSDEIAHGLRKQAMERLDACAREFFPDVAHDLSPSMQSGDDR